MPDFYFILFLKRLARCRWETTIFSTTLHSLSYGIR